MLFMGMTTSMMYMMVCNDCFRNMYACFLCKFVCVCVYVCVCMSACVCVRYHVIYGYDNQHDVYDGMK